MQVTNKTAILAQQLRFDWDTFYAGNEDECHSAYDLLNKFTFNIGDIIQAYVKLKENWFLIPTQETLLKWLREKHNIHLEVTWYGTKDNLVWSYSYGYIGKEDIQLATVYIKETNKNFKSFEKATEAGLIDVCKYLINENKT